MADAKDPKLALFELYLATAEKLSDRRAQANAWMGTRPGRFERRNPVTPMPRCEGPVSTHSRPLRCRTQIDLEDMTRAVA